MNNSKTTIALTGVTGLLGRNLLFEYFKQQRDDLTKVKIVIFGRDQKDTTHKDRIRDIFLNDGRYYLSLSDDELTPFLDYLDKEVLYINLNLDRKDLGLSDKDIDILSTLNFDIFYHAGADTSFSSSKDKVINVNTEGTDRLLQLLKKLSVKRLCYYSSAFVAGRITKKVYPDNMSVDRDFRNPYEHSKILAELAVRKFEKESGVDSYIFRTAILSGRLIEDKIGQIHKYDVFYVAANFFSRLKQSLLPDNVDYYTTPLEIDMRIERGKKTTLNIIPVDYAAKASIAIMSLEYISSSSFHLVNSYETEMVAPMLEFLNISGYTFVDKEPEDKNMVEKYYYRIIGNIFTGYLHEGGKIYYDNSSLLKNLPNHITCPKVDKDDFFKLLDFAKNTNFGKNT